MTFEATFTKRVSSSRANFVIWIPKDVAMIMDIKRGEVIEVKIKKLRGGSKS